MKHFAMFILATSLIAWGCDGSNVPSAPEQPPPGADPPAVAPSPPVPPPAPVGVISVTYVLKAINGQSLPVKSPYGAGDWDYDADAGTWQLTGAYFAVSDNGTYTNGVFHQAASGRTSTEYFVGKYTRASPSTILIEANGSTSTATISDDWLVWDWGNGTTMTFER